MLGPLAPPVGGVSIHISRITELLHNDFEFDFIDESRVIKKSYFNIRSLKFFQYFKKVKQTNVLHIHSGNKILRIFHLLAGKLFGKRIILTLHSFVSKTSQFSCFINGMFYRLADTIIVVSPEIEKRLNLPSSKTIVKEAFIPPQNENEPELPFSIRELISKKINEGNTIICANASRLDKHNNQDLYGLDLCIEVAKRLIEKKIALFFIFVVASLEKNAATFYKSKEVIKELGLSEEFILTNESLSFAKLIEKSDIIIRPTNTDGDSLTIREALFLNKLVLASDIVKRPDGVYIFQNRDLEDMEKKLEDLIKKKEDHLNLNKCKHPITFDNYKKFYFDLLNVQNTNQL